MKKLLLSLSCALALFLFPQGAVAAPDLVITQNKMSPLAIHQESAFTINTVVRNRGATAVRPGHASVTRAYLSVDDRYSPGDISITSRKTKALAKGQMLRFNIKTSTTAKPGKYYVIVCADATKRVREYLEQNNCRVGNRITVRQKKPVNTTRPQIQGVAEVGSRITCSPGKWRGHDSLKTMLIKNGAVAANESEEHVIETSDIGATFACRVVATNKGGSTIATSTGLGPVRAVNIEIPAPVNSSIPQIQGIAQSGQTLTCLPGGWDHVDNNSFTYQWLVGGQPKAATASYVAADEDIGKLITCQVTAGNATASVTADSANVGPILPMAPLNTVLPGIQGVSQINETLTCGAGTWANQIDQYSFSWLRSGAVIDGETTSELVLTAADEDSLISCRVAATNLGGISVADSLPTTAVLPLIPINMVAPVITGVAQIGEMLNCSTGDWEHTVNTYSYKWFVDGNEAAGETDSDYVPGAADEDKTVVCEVTAGNAAGSETAASAPSGAVLPLLPSNTSLPVISGTAQIGETLNCSLGTWENTVNTYARQWYAGGNEIISAGDEEYVLVAADEDKLITCQVTATNGAGSTSATSLATSPVLPLAPVNLTLPVVTGTAQVGETLSCSTGTWDHTVDSYARQWLADGNEINDATDQEYVVNGADEDAILACQVTASNAAGSTSATSLATSPVLPLVPVNLTLPVVTGTAQIGETLSCSLGTWNHTVNAYARQWHADGNELDGATGQDYVPTAFDEDKQITCEVTATNAAGSATATSIETDPVLPLPPLSISPPYIVGSMQVSQALTCMTGSWQNTIDSFSYQWLADDNVLIGFITSAYTVQPTDEGKVITCEVVAVNAAGSTSSTSSPGTPVLPLLPENLVLPEISGTAQVGQTLSCSTGSWANTINGYGYEWYVNDIQEGDEHEYVVAAGDEDKTIYCQVVASNDAGSASAMSLSTDPVLPMLPVSTTAPEITGTVQVGEVVSCSLGNWSNTVNSYTRQWYADEEEIDAADGQDYTIQAVDEGKHLECEVTATNAAGSTSATSAETAMVLPAAPINVDLPEISGDAVVGEELSCSQGAWTGSSLGYAYSWLRGVDIIGGANASTYILTEDDYNQPIRCQVTASNTGGSVSASSDATDPVLPLPPVNVTAPEITGDAQAGKTLTCSQGSWDGLGTISYSYEWLVGGDAIGGETGDSYLVVGEDIGSEVVCKVTASNTGGAVSASSDPTNGVITSESMMVATGDAHTCALDGAEQLSCLGQNLYGQNGNGVSGFALSPERPIDSDIFDDKTIAQMATGNSFSCAIADDNLYCWGANSLGQLGVGGGGHRVHPALVEGALADKTVERISILANHTCAIADSRAYCWGYNQYGQVGNGSVGGTFNAPQAVVGIIADEDVLDIASGNEHTCAISSGKAYCWGRNSYGQLGNGTTTDSSLPVEVDTTGVLAGKTLVAIIAGNFHSCALDSTGQAYCWGYDSSGQLGRGVWLPTTATVPTEVSTSGVLAGKTLIAINAGPTVTCAIDSDGAAYCWGQSYLGNGTQTGTNTPVLVSGVLSGKIVDNMSVGQGNICAVSEGKTYCWGNNNYGLVGDGTSTGRTSPVMIFDSSTVSNVSVGATHACLSTSSTVHCWGHNGNGPNRVLGFEAPELQLGPFIVNETGALADKTVTAIYNGVGHSCAIADNRAYCWGGVTKYAGMLGHNSETHSSEPVGVTGDLENLDVVKMSLGEQHTCAVADGKAYCWGLGSSGALGHGSTVSSPVPVLIGGLLAGKTVTDIATGYMNTCAVADGKAYCWGNGSSGKNGTGNDNSTTTPAEVYNGGELADATIVKIAGNHQHTCALDSDGKAYCWGRGSSGELGNGTSTESNVPVAVNTSGVLNGKTITDIAANGNITCVLADGSPYCWGGGAMYGPLPVAIDTSGALARKNITSISVGNNYACVVADGNVYCWGNNGYAQLGTGASTGIPTTLPVASLLKN